MTLNIHPSTIGLDYDTLAARTAPVSEYKAHYDLMSAISTKSLVEDLLTIAYRAACIDIYKKTLFYGKADPIREKANSAYADHMHRFDRQKVSPVDITKIPVDLLHSIMGLVTEVGEIIEACLTTREVGEDGYYVIDRVNLVEEYGDVLWYVPLGLRTIGSNIGECMYVNIRKLETRFPEKFDTWSANNRNLVEERKVLEAGAKDESECLEYTGDGFPIAPWPLTGAGYQPILTPGDFDD